MVLLTSAIILQIINNSLFDNITEYQMSFKGSWKTGLNAGGWLECESFYQNPQFLITLHTDGEIFFFKT